MDGELSHACCPALAVTASRSGIPVYGDGDVVALGRPAASPGRLLRYPASGRWIEVRPSVVSSGCCPAMPPKGWECLPTRPGCGGTLRRMGTESHAELIEAIRRFLDDATRAIGPAAVQRLLDDARGRGERADISPDALAQALTALPTCIEANALARKASLAAGYLLPEPGRPLDADALVSIGLVGTLLDPSADLQAVASDLAGYLAGPPVDIWDYAIIDGIGTLQDPIRSWMGGNW